MKQTHLTALATAGVLAVVLSVGAVPAGAQCGPLTGAIFTTNQWGTQVNGNIYPSKEAVYLNGGPGPNAPPSAAGLPDGVYYYQVTDPSGVQVLSTGSLASRMITVVNGVFVSLVQLAPFNDTPNAGGVYKVWVTPVACYNEAPIGFKPSASKTDNFKVWSSAPSYAKITGSKFYDTNADGSWSLGEPAIPGWRIELWKNGVLVDTATTNSVGAYEFMVYQTGTYVVKEVMPLGNWVQTWPPAPGYHSIAIGSLTKQTLGNYNCGNVRYGCPGGGLTPGFWSNKNGQALFGADDLAAMVALNLRQANGAHFDPASYAAFETWLKDVSATNMAYMLSVHLAAMRLNVLNGQVNGTALVYAPGVPGANAAGFIAINDLIASANASLGANGSTPSGSFARAGQELLKNALDRANNNLNFVCSSPGTILYP